MNKWSVVALAFFAISAQAATTVYDNSAAAVGGGNIVNGTTLIESFSTGPSTSTLASLQLGVGAVLPGDGAVINIALYSNSTSCSSGSNCPGSLLANLGTIADSAALNITPVSLGSNPVLAANTRYWIVATQSSGSGSWHFSTDVSGTGVSTEFHGAGSLTSSTANTQPFAYQMQVTVNSTPSATPIPSSSILMLVGIATLAFGLHLRTSKLA